jgi:hypothetical protein
VRYNAAIVSESRKDFHELDAEFGHDFATLSQRLTTIFHQLHALAHADGSSHSEQEELRMSVGLDGDAFAVQCEVDEYDWMRVRSQNILGGQIQQYRCSLKTENKHVGGKHRAGGSPVNNETAKRPSVTQLDKMILMAGILEASYADLSRNDGSTIIAYEHE